MPYALNLVVLLYALVFSSSPPPIHGTAHNFGVYDPTSTSAREMQATGHHQDGSGSGKQADNNDDEDFKVTTTFEATTTTTKPRRNTLGPDTQLYTDDEDFKVTTTTTESHHNTLFPEPAGDSYTRTESNVTTPAGDSNMLTGSNITTPGVMAAKVNTTTSMQQHVENVIAVSQCVFNYCIMVMFAIVFYRLRQLRRTMHVLYHKHKDV